MIRSIQILVTLILIQVFALTMTAMVAPEKYGEWLQRIDTGRFEMIDCDCTEALE
jgi:hypothetical protein